MVYITGDCHADFTKFSEDFFPEQKEMSRNDTVIVCGDFGLWHDDAEERGRMTTLEGRPFTIAFVDGNHENFDRLCSDEFEVVDFHGGKAHRIRENVYHLMRGHIFDFEGKSFFAFGGAQSHDIDDGILDRDEYSSDESFMNEIRLWYRERRMFRINHVSWWEQELPTQEEMDFGTEQLVKHGNRVDYIISHCCPQEVAAMFGYYEHDTLTRYFNEVAHSVQFDKWFFGHYHDNRNVMSKFVMLYENIERIL